MPIGPAIKSCRTKCNVRQYALAKRLGISQSRLSMIEKGTRDPGFSLVERIAKELKIPLELILFLACDRPASNRFKKQLDAIGMAAQDILTDIR